MISVYNEMKKPWLIKDRKPGSKVIQLAKTRQLLPTDEYPEAKKRSTSTLFASSLFKNDLDLTSDLLKCSGMDTVVRISEEKTSIVFNKKALRPYVCHLNENSYSRDILLASIWLGGRDLIYKDTVDAYLLDYMITGGEISFTLAFREEGLIRLVFLDREAKRIYEKEFRNVNGDITVSTVERDAEPAEVEADRVQLKKYRPHYPSYVILTKPEDRSALTRTNIKPFKHNIVEFTNQNITEVLEELRGLRYRAITLFTNTTDENRNDIGHIAYVNQLSAYAHQAMNTVLLMERNGRVKYSEAPSLV